VVSLIDVVGVRRMAKGPKGAASSAMRKFHGRVLARMEHTLPLHAHGYLWNDSVLLLAFLDDAGRHAETVLREIDRFKKEIEDLGANYAIAIQGQAFPDPMGTAGHDRVTVIRASSFALANCFEVEKFAREKKLRRPWYVDSRLARHINTAQAFSEEAVRLLPDGKERTVYAYKGYLWPDEG